jgi:hypothetical protein
LKPELRESLAAEKTRLTNEAAQIDDEIQLLNRSHSAAVTRLKGEASKLETEIFRLTADLQREQDAAVAKLRVILEKQKADIKTSIVTANTELTRARAAYKTREAFYTKENSVFHDAIAGESNRIVIAGRDTSCPIANEARQFVALNWNKLLPCVSGATSRAKPYGTNVFGSYCPKEVNASALGKYKTFLSGLAPDEISSVKANSNEGWYESLFNK